VWDLRSRRRPVELQGGMPPPGDIPPPCGQPAGCSPWSRDSRYIAGVTLVHLDYHATVWDARSGVGVGLGRNAYGAAFMPDMRVLVLDEPGGGTVVNPASATTCDGGPIHALPAGGRLRAKQCATLPTRAPIDGADFTTSGRILTLSGGDIGLWDGDGHNVGGRGARPTLPGGVQAAAITPDGRLLAVGMLDGVEAYDERGRRWRVASQPPHDVTQLAFDAAAKHLLAVGNDRTARVWEVGHLDRRPKVLRHPSSVLDAEFSPGEGLVLTAGADGRARLWDPPLQATLLELRTSPQGGARFSNDGRFIALGALDAVRLGACEICAPFGQLVRLARARLPD